MACSLVSSLSSLAVSSSSYHVQSVSAASIASATSTALAMPTVPATLALQCLRSVPNKPRQAVRLVESLRAFVQWQSTLAYLKDPPLSYTAPAVDILGGLDDVAARARAGEFASEYDFQLAIADLIAGAHDGHLGYIPDVFRAFKFENGLVKDLVSVSRDGKEVPKLYHYSMLSNFSRDANFTMPPAITAINGEDAAAVIERSSLRLGSFQDADAQWNHGFKSYAAPRRLPALASSLVFESASITLTYDDGTSRTEETIAVIGSGDFDGVDSGENFYGKFCDPETVARTTTTTTVTSTPSTTSILTSHLPEPTISGYPYPVIRDSGANITAGYFLNGSGYDDVAVLAIRDFAPRGNTTSSKMYAYLRDYQSTIATFLAACKREDKRRLVIDLTANGGGMVVTAYDLFTQLFPNITQFQGTNMRLTDSLMHIAQVAGSYRDEIISFASRTSPPTVAGNLTIQAHNSAIWALSQSPIVRNILPPGLYTPRGTEFATTDEIITPVHMHGDRFTAYENLPLNETSSKFNMTGTGNRPRPAASAFDPEDVVLLTDGTCGSTCTLFSYLMILRAGVKAVVIGGRPGSSIMQSVGGVEGAQVFGFMGISQAAEAVLKLRPELNVTGSNLQLLAEGHAIDRARYPEFAGSVNGKNAYSPTDSQVPLQFLFQPANCHIFYTKEMIFGPTETWRHVVDAAWADPQRFCVHGSRVKMDVLPSVIDRGFFNSSSGHTRNSSQDRSGASPGETSFSSVGAVPLIYSVPRFMSFAVLVMFLAGVLTP